MTDLDWLFIITGLIAPVLGSLVALALCAASVAAWNVTKRRRR